MLPPAPRSSPTRSSPTRGQATYACLAHVDMVYGLVHHNVELSSDVCNARISSTAREACVEYDIGSPYMGIIYNTAREARQPPGIMIIVLASAMRRHHDAGQDCTGVQRRLPR